MALIQKHSSKNTRGDVERVPHLFLGRVCFCCQKEFCCAFIVCVIKYMSWKKHVHICDTREKRRRKWSKQWNERAIKKKTLEIERRDEIKRACERACRKERCKQTHPHAHPATSNKIETCFQPRKPHLIRKQNPKKTRARSRSCNAQAKCASELWQRIKMLFS